MHPFEFVISVVALVFLYKLITAWLRHRESRPAVDADATNSELLKRLAEVEERVRVLERIVTDERFELHQQFKDLGGR